MSVQVSYKKQFVLGIMLLIVTLVVVEVLVNIWLYNFYRCDFEDNEIFAKMNPETKRKMCIESLGFDYVNMRISWINGTRPGLGGIDENIVKLNSEGFRGPEFTKKIPENTYRIFTIGGSTTFGVGVFDNQTYPYYLQEIFDEVNFGKRVEVVNLGRPGWSSVGEVKQMKEKFSEYHPDVFVVYDGWNDMILTIKGNPKATAEQWKQRWIELCEFGKQSGFDTIVILHPMVGRGNKILTNQESEFLIKPAQQNILEIFPSYEKQINELKIHCSNSVDFKNIFDNIQEPIYFDAGHTGSLGNQIIAENIYQLLLPFVSNNTALADGNENPTLIEKDYALISQDLDDSENGFVTTLQKIISLYKTPKIFPLIFKEF